MEQVFMHVMNLTIDCFNFAYNLLTSINIFGSVSIYDILIVFYVCTLVPILLATRFGSRGMAIGMGNAIGNKKSDDPKYNKSYKALKGKK